jgi:hypothetical protein
MKKEDMNQQALGEGILETVQDDDKPTGWVDAWVIYAIFVLTHGDTYYPNQWVRVDLEIWPLDLCVFCVTNWAVKQSEMVDPNT